MFKKGDKLKLYGNIYQVLSSDKQLTLAKDLKGIPSAFPTDKLLKMVAMQLKKAIEEKKAEREAQLPSEDLISLEMAKTYTKYLSLINSKVPKEHREEIKECLEEWLSAKGKHEAMKKQHEGKQELTKAELSGLMSAQTEHENCFEKLKNKIVNSIKNK